MLKSTHKAISLPPLPDEWTEHKAPSGHSYYYNTLTKQSTYTRPLPYFKHTPDPVLFNKPSENNNQYINYLNSPISGTKFKEGLYGIQADLPKEKQRSQNKKQIQKSIPNDRPKSCQIIPGHENWRLVLTKFNRRFVYDTKKGQSFWRIPDKLKKEILALDQLRIKEKAISIGVPSTQDSTSRESQNPIPTKFSIPTSPIESCEEDKISENEEANDTDSEQEEENDYSQQQLGVKVSEKPVEFNEDDIAYQLETMGEEYGLDLDEGSIECNYDNVIDGFNEVSNTLFKDLLNDFNINPYSPWDKLVDEGKLVNDSRYTTLPTMKIRKKVWEEWSREKIKYLQEVRVKEEKKDPRVKYLEFLQKYATPKLYWPEFKRKYRKEDAMRDPVLPDKDREKIYREYISRLKLPLTMLKSDLSTLLREQSTVDLNNTTMLDRLPTKILTDLRYISVEPLIRKELVEAYISTLPLLPEESKDQNLNK